MALSVKEVFRTVQGEGSLAGTPAVFLRLGGCNLWSGHEDSRGNGVGDCAKWCDTDFINAEKMEVDVLVSLVEKEAVGMNKPLVVITGGEPLLQLKKKSGSELLSELRKKGFKIAIETNGTVEIPIMLRAKLDHITVSPKVLNADQKSLANIKTRSGTDLKVVVPSPMAELLAEMGLWKFEHFFVQPKDVNADNGESSLEQTIQLAEKHGFRISVQTHKMLGLP